LQVHRGIHAQATERDFLGQNSDVKQEFIQFTLRIEP
jgi:hypothetical protein